LHGLLNVSVPKDGAKQKTFTPKVKDEIDIFRTKSIYLHLSSMLRSF